MEQRFDDADECGVEFIALQHLGKLGRHVIDDLTFQAPRERNGIKSLHRPDAEFAERLIQRILALDPARDLRTFDPFGAGRRIVRRRHAKLWN
jgi:hypothetical protein